MSLSMYQASIPVFIRMLNNLKHLLDLAVQHAETHKFDPSVLPNVRLYPNMYPLTKQVQIATDMVKGGAARLAGETPPSWPDDEATLEQLQARVDKALAFLSGFSPAQIDGSENKEIVLKWPGRTLNFTGQDYLLNFVLPNFYFHITTTYALLRHNGVPVGKSDFIGD
ncbi:DUF1993 domain-containing protein [Leeia oryzae]|uniref:DUF1993 domain-containing protein n=1 Tax=Leeia oryzae TaxID=356662 RepID=UPI000475EFCE|nr:DUF1993 domain-containing protein [Leeia oryzae]